ncbi:MAG: hypothetical protein PHO01_11045 [Desulfotomaculaceae bacterium]|nr:hypothetical protein [Desulfotomaculaceae bacterium]
MLINAPEHLNLEVGTFRREFVVSQILGEHARAEPRSMSSTGSQLLYLRIPSGVEVQSKNPITFVE